MERKVIIQKDMPSTKWSGGTTTQLYIEPEGLTVKGDFDFRISTATVDRGDSVFTNFKGYDRLLIILDGSLELRHEKGNFEKLQPFFPHFFPGDVITVSRSDENIVDFNFIWKRELGECSVKKIDQKNRIITFNFQNQKFTYSFNSSEGWKLTVEKI